MRSITFGALLVGLLLPACGGGDSDMPPAQAPSPPQATVSSASTSPVTTGTTPTEAPKASLADLEKQAGDGIMAALNAHDADKAASYFTDDAVFVFAGMPDVKDKASWKDHMQKVWAAFPDAKYAPGRAWVKNDVVVGEWGFSGTNSGPFMGQPATNKPVGIMGVGVHWFTPDGKVKETHTYMDAGSVAFQLGVKKAMGRPTVTLPAAPELHTAKGTPDEDNNAALAKNFAAILEKKDSKAFLDTMTDDATYDMNTAPAAMSGKKDGEKWFKAMTKAFPDLKSNLSNVWGVEDYVIDEYTMTGTNKGALSFGPKMTIPATNKPISTHGVEILQFKDGKMVHGWGYENGMEFAMQLGLIKPPGQAAAGAAGKDKPAKDKPAKPTDASKATQ